MRDEPSSRATWAYPAALPHRIWDYPIPALMPVTSPQPPTRWPPAMDPQMREFDEATAGLPRTNFIYVHMPFCPFHCSFCGFYTKVSKEDNASYVDLIEREIALYRDHVPSAQESAYEFIYFGGGTPSQMSAEQLLRRSKVSRLMCVYAVM
ncbi:MAG: hypothetical protein GEV03_25530 [Streptosporangiales bacterium]|nr:hypothetical protein [Streptosporangiales bacterium]